MSIIDSTIVSKTIAIAIDFGTSRTGYSYGFPGSQKSYKELNWEDSPEKYCKTLTQIAYDGSGRPEYWGFTAWKQMLDDEEQLNLFKFFKMGLHTKDQLVMDTSGTVQKEAMDLIVDYLTLLFEKIRDDLTGKVGKEIEPGEIIWCLTIPAIWTFHEKIAMRKAAYKARMIEVEDPPEDTFMLVLEPEAAAVYCMMQLKRQGSPLIEGDKFLVLDAGGGTVDLTSHIFSKGKLREICAGTGGALGSSELDKRFEELMEELFGRELMEEFRTKKVFQHFELMNNWERTKCKTIDLNKKVSVKAPGAFSAMLRRANIQNDYFDHDSGTILLPPNLVQSKIYGIILEDICSLVDHQFQACEKETGSPFDYIFIVGGFGGSRILQNKIKENYTTRVKKSIVIPPEPGEAIVDGALYIGLDPGIIASRRMRMTYGCSVARTFVSGTHCPTKMLHTSTGDHCSDCFDKFVTNGEEIEFDQGVSRTYCPLFPNQISMSIAVYGTLATNLVYVDEPASSKIGEIKIDMSDTTGGLNRTVRVTMYFGKSEIKLHAVERNSGRKYEAVFITR